MEPEQKDYEMDGSCSIKNQGIVNIHKMKIWTDKVKLNSEILHE